MRELALLFLCFFPCSTQNALTNSATLILCGIALAIWVLGGKGHGVMWTSRSTDTGELSYLYLWIVVICRMVLLGLHLESKNKKGMSKANATCSICPRAGKCASL